METTLEKREAQLKLWESQIHHLAIKTQVAGVEPGFDAVMFVDELKALQAIARSNFAEFRVARDADRKRLKAEMKKSWKDLEVALQSPRGRR